MWCAGGLWCGGVGCDVVWCGVVWWRAVVGWGCGHSARVGEVGEAKSYKMNDLDKFKILSASLASKRLAIDENGFGVGAIWETSLSPRFS